MLFWFFFKLGEQAFLQTIAIRPYHAGPQSLAMCHNLTLVLIPHEKCPGQIPAEVRLYEKVARNN